MKISFLLMFLFTFIFSCSQKKQEPDDRNIFYPNKEIKTDDVLETYRYWAEEDPGDSITLLHGKYWQSAHFTKEYIMFLHFRSTPTKTSAFLLQSGLKKVKDKTPLPDDSPSWFRPSSDCSVWAPDGFSQGSVYYCDSAKSEFWVYEIQL